MRSNKRETGRLTSPRLVSSPAASAWPLALFSFSPRREGRAQRPRRRLRRPPAFARGWAGRASACKGTSEPQLVLASAAARRTSSVRSPGRTAPCALIAIAHSKPAEAERIVDRPAEQAAGLAHVVGAVEQARLP